MPNQIQAENLRHGQALSPGIPIPFQASGGVHTALVWRHSDIPQHCGEPLMIGIVSRFHLGDKMASHTLVRSLRAGRVNRKIRQRMNQLHSFLHDVLLAVFASLESSRTRWDTPSTVYARLARDRTCERNFEHERPSVLGTTLLHECIKILYSENGEPAIWNHH